MIPRIRCPGCEFHWSAHHLPAHWCEATKPGKLNLQYPNPCKTCPKLPAVKHEETARLEEFA